MVSIESKFMGNFKLGDNIVHNLNVLGLLYRVYAAENNEGKRLLCKPIILLLVSIIEGVLFDLHDRIKFFTIEGVKNIPLSVTQHIRLSRIDDLEKYIASAKKQNLFDEVDKQFYAHLDDLRRLRNRIHIQNVKKDFEPDEFNAFNQQRKILAERALEKTLRTMERKFARDKDHVAPFILPWEAHYPLAVLANAE
jgi:hypothetical protein